MSALGLFLSKVVWESQYRTQGLPSLLMKWAQGRWLVLPTPGGEEVAVQNSPVYGLLQSHKGAGAEFWPKAARSL